MIKLETRKLKDVPEDGLFLIKDAADGIHLLRRDGMIAHDIAETKEMARWEGFYNVGKIYGVRIDKQVAFMGVILNVGN